MKKQLNNKNTDANLEFIAEQWVNLVLTQIETRKLADNPQVERNSGRKYTNYRTNEQT